MKRELEEPISIRSSDINTANWDKDIAFLKKLHKSVVTIYTFLVSSGRYIVTTYSAIKPAVEKDIGRPLTVDDLAQIKYLVPDDVVLAYVDENQVEEHAAPVTTRNGFETTDRDIYRLSTIENDGFEEQDEIPVEPPRRLLVFEFVDGKVRPEVAKKRKMTPTPRPASKIVKPPRFSVENIKKMIDKRIEKYSVALEAFRLSCLASGVDLLATLEERSKPFIPVLEQFEDPVEYMMKNSGNAFENKESGSIAKFIRDVKQSPDYADQIVKDGEIHVISRDAQYGSSDICDVLSYSLVIALKELRNITRLYSHQELALNSLKCDKTKGVIVTTSTSSGKSLVFQLPVLDSLLKSKDTTTAMYIFPTKALAQDQKRSFLELLNAIPELQGIVAETYDGDTDQEKRYFVRNNSNIIFTNPDMVHASILPNWDLWATFLRNLKCIVVDELHIYSGLFGAHVAYIMRRLLRIVNELGNTDVKIISCSATVRNPLNLMSNIFGFSSDEIVVVDKDGSSMGSRTYLLWNCRYVSPKDHKSGRVHPVGEAAHLLINLTSRGIRTIAFCRVRRTCELLMKSVRSMLETSGRTDLLSRLMAYRGGYSLEDRRRIEKEMFDGRLLGIVATNALELGIDIGNLDAVLIVGFPFTISNLRQQCGRAGRRNHDALALIIGSGDAVDQYYMNNPNAIMEAPDADIPLALDNLLIQESHLQCGAYELPIRLDIDAKYFGFSIEADATEKQVWEDLVKSRLVELEEVENAYTCQDKYLPQPSSHVVIRGIEEDEFAVVDTTNNRNVVMETVEASRVMFTLYEGGIFIHQGQPYLVQEFNPTQKYAKVARVDVDWITRQRDYTNVDPIETELYSVLSTEEDLQQGERYAACFGRIRYEAVVFGFFKIDKRDRIVDAVEVDNPPWIYESKGFWIDVPNSALRILKQKGLSIAGAVHGAEHALLSLFPMFVTALPGEVSTECKAPEKEYSHRTTNRKRPARLIFCDRKGGKQGAGISRKAFEFADDLVRQALDRVESCPCEFGCPGCVASPQCREHSEIISKVGALVIFKELRHAPLDLETIPQGPEPNLKKATSAETVIAASPVKMTPKARSSMMDRKNVPGVVLFPE
ncbi:Hrq1p [Sugiyamaella lignohabitans]|uniref:Hrq1p n=1 Tax=Sugiyamaella lignohabitans TaxID=796027 RepID=A0A167FLJ3_9ASCO|nr:Hrq1p [Sugiyamaella lignohabitans]ANB15454.1 Hrq1p [Sugiyamaella lignohabitans]